MYICVYVIIMIIIMIMNMYIYIYIYIYIHINILSPGLAAQLPAPLVDEAQPTEQRRGGGALALPLSLYKYK